MTEEEKRTSEQILDLAAERRREREVVDVEVERRLLVVFHLESPPQGPEISHPVAADGLYGLPASAVESIVPVQEITHVPGTPGWVLGVVNVRGEIESVLDLGAVLGLGQAEITPESRLLIAQHQDLRSGLLVDQMVDIVEVASSDINPAPAPQEGGKGVYIAGETRYAHDDRTLVILNLSEIFRRALEVNSS
jgi:purine-binding chemotaxis protein CheW